jgi:hypothetical protein
MSGSASHLIRKHSTIVFQPISGDSCAFYRLIFFVTGNPGLIAYYHTFLSTLHQLLSEKSRKQTAGVYHIYGQSLAGFEDDDQLPSSKSAPWSLGDQIAIQLQSLNRQKILSGPRKGQCYDEIILIGHSVGAYIIMEMLNRLRKVSPSPKVKGAILLFPTVVHLAKSTNGLRFSSFLRIPGLPRVVDLFAKISLWPLPRPMLKWLVRLVTGMPGDGAEVTTKFLVSRMGIWEALWVLHTIRLR